MTPFTQGRGVAQRKFGDETGLGALGDGATSGRGGEGRTGLALGVEPGAVGWCLGWVHGRMGMMGDLGVWKLGGVAGERLVGWSGCWVWWVGLLVIGCGGLGWVYQLAGLQLR